MIFNSLKFECVQFGRKSPTSDEHYYLSSNTSKIINTEHVQDLGVTLSKDCTFQSHIAKTVKSCSQMAGWILRTFSSRERQILLPVYKQLVLCRAEYCSVLWAPADAKSIAAIESIQRAFTRKIQNYRGQDRPNYWERLESLRLYSLQRRRERYSIIYMWKVLRGLVPNPGIEYKVNDRTGIHICLPTIEKTSPPWLKRLRQNSFTFRGAQLFNCLPRELRKLDPIQSLDSYKSQLDKMLSCIPDQPTVSGLLRPARSNSLVDQMCYIRK